MKTKIRNAEWAIVWNGSSHEYRKSIDIVFEGDTILFVGSAYDGTVDETIDGAGLMFMPGLVDAHSHIGIEPPNKGIREEHGVPNMYMCGLYERVGAFNVTSPELNRASTEVALSELLLSGVTSICDIDFIYDGWVDLFDRSGIRGFLAPGFASARWKIENDHRLDFEWDEMGGQRGLDAAIDFVDRLASHPSGRLSGVISPMQIENCTDDLLRDSFDAARDSKMPYTLHLAQSVPEVHEMLRRHGRTPIQHAKDIGILGPTSVFGHALFLDTHSWVRWWTREDLKLLADSGSSVAHCPTPFSRYGQIMESFGDYVRAGINMAIGTDTTPHNMWEEIRKAGTFARISSRDINNVSSSMLFHAATIGGANAMQRSDIGRLAAGCKADLVAIDLTNPVMMPVHDPLRTLIFHAADRAVKDVWVAGRKVVSDGKVTTLDYKGASERLAEAQARMIADVPKHDYRGRTADQIVPLSLPVRA